MSNTLRSFSALGVPLLLMPRERVIQLGSISERSKTVPLVLLAATLKSSGPGPARIPPFHSHSAGGKSSFPDSCRPVTSHNLKVQPPIPGHWAANRFPFRENFGFVALSKKARSRPVAGSHTFTPVYVSQMSIELSGEISIVCNERLLFASAIVLMISPESLFLIWISLSDSIVANHRPSGEKQPGQSKVGRCRPRDISHSLGCSLPGG